MLQRTFKNAIRDFGVTLFLLISREILNAMVRNMAALRLWTFERFEVTVMTSSVSESEASMVMEVLRVWQTRSECVLEER